MLSWTLEDDLVVSIGSDYLLRTWDWKTGTMLAKYSGHQNETYALVAHPLHRVVISLKTRNRNCIA
jgi:WD40 repeat protein